jgi:hypothetical protein
VVFGIVVIGLHAELDTGIAMKKIMVLLVIFLAGCQKDDTDPPNGVSGLNIFVDAKTNCQYLGQGDGGITPRLDRNGKQICGV